ncbi:MAG: nickel-responsive transcriptional regulator NikR [Planctomycetota bacterium]
MSSLVRLSVSLEAPLARQLDALAAAGHCANRSEFVRDLIRDRAVETQWEDNAEALGTITLIYDHHQRQLNEKLIHLQHENPHAILATTHVHLDHDLCAEMIMMRDRASSIRRMADLLGRQKGVLHSALAMSSTGQGLGAGAGASTRTGTGSAADHAHEHPHSHAHPHPHAPAPRRGRRG